MIFAQFFHNSTGYDIKTNTFSKEHVRPIEMCGSDGVLILDGRFNVRNMKIIATDVGRKRGAIGFTIHQGTSFIRNSLAVSYTPIDPS